MPSDRFGLPLSTASQAAADAYVRGIDCLFALLPGGAEAFDAATTADPGFALAHLGRAQCAALAGDPAGVRSALAAANDATGLSAREASHRAFFNLLFSSRFDEARQAAATHLAEWPRDAGVLNQFGPILGLVATSGLPHLKQLQAEVMDAFAPHYGEDWWFTSWYAQTLMEVGRLGEAETVTDTALRGNPRSAVAAHARGHLAYETGDIEGGRRFLRSWRATYPRDGGLHCHISWHLALAELAAGNHDEAFRVYAETVSPGNGSGPPRTQVYDAIAFIWRWELAGNPRDPERWRALRAFARTMIPEPGNLGLLEIHVLLADALAGETEAMQARIEALERFSPGRCHGTEIVAAVARGLAAYAEGRYDTAIGILAPLMSEIERLGGSLAQLDLVEFTLLRACVDAGRHEDLRAALLARRRNVPAIPVAGLH
jgi:tetratricopeptide (TPR) repeat protein